MKIYNHLFYHCYELALRVKNERDHPLLYALGITGFCIIMHLLVVVTICEKLFGLNISEFIFGLPKYTIAIFLFAVLFFYYKYINNHKKLYNNYKFNVLRPRKTSRTLFVVLSYFFGSIALSILVIELLR